MTDPRRCEQGRGSWLHPVARLTLLLAGLGLSVLLASCAGPPKEVEPQFFLYPPPPATPRIQFLKTISTDKDVIAPLGAFERFVLGDPEPRVISKAYGVAIHDGQILVCDTRSSVVEVFDLVARDVLLLGADRSGHLSAPINIAVDEDGTRYVTDTDLKRVMVYDRENRFLTALGDPEALNPSDVAISGQQLFVTDLENGQVVVLDKRSGEEIRRWGLKGSGKGEMFLPTNIELDAEGNVFVTDTGNFRVLKFDPDGRLLKQIGSLGRSLGQFVRPKGIAVDREGRLYVVDSAFENVQVFDSEGKLLLFFAEAGNHPGGVNLPAKVEIDYDNVDLFAEYVAPGHRIEYVILVTSQFGGNKVNIYGFLEQGEGGDH